MAGWGRGLFYRAWQQACHSQDTRVVRWLPGFLPESVTHVLAHGFAPRTFEGRIGCGERLGQIAQIVRLTALVAAVGQGCGYSRHQTRLLSLSMATIGHSRCFRGARKASNVG